MKMKKFLAFMLAGTLSLSNSIWVTAETLGTANDAVKKSAAEDAASPSNAELMSTDIGEILNNNAASYAIIWKEYEESVYCGQDYNVTIQNQGSSELYLDAKIVCPDGKTVSSYCGWAAGMRETEVEIPGALFSTEGLYKICFVDREDDSSQYSDLVSVQVEKLPSMTIQLTSNVFSGVYYQETLSKDRISYGQYHVIQTAGNVTLGNISLTNVTAVCVKEANSDTYVIKEMSSDQCDRITVEENEYARPNIEKSTLESFSLKQEELSLYERESIALETVITGKADESEIIWESSDDQVASVNNGIVTGYGEGSAVITAKLQGLEAVCKVTVKKTFQSLSLEPAETNTNSGRVYQMAVSVEPADMADAVMRDIQWSSSNEEIAKVDSNGYVTTCKPGSCYIRAEVGGKFAEYQVRVIEAHPLEVRVMADGYEKVINLTGNDYFEEGKMPEALEMKQLPEGLKKYFDQEPAVEGTSVKFKLKPSTEEFQIDVPMSMKGGGYTEYNNDCTLRITGRSSVKVALRTEEEIREFFRLNPFRDNTQQNDTWDIEPAPEQDIAGKISEETAENVLNALNFVRYVAGIPADVVNNEELEELAQTGTAVLMQRRKEYNAAGLAASLTHTPEKPAGVSEEFYQKGLEGTSSSNIAAGASLMKALLSGWMNDGDETNIAGVGHRKWCLNPFMKETGFGRAGDYTAMSVADNSNREQSPNYSFIPWPAQNMPVEYFEGPWSVCLNSLVYNVKRAENVTVTMVYQGDEYVLDENNKNPKGKYFNVSFAGEEQGSVVVFQPGVEFHAGDQVDIKISGFKDDYGNELPIEYSVNFFSMDMKTVGSLILDEEFKELTVNSEFTLKAFMVQSDGSEVLAENVKWSSTNEKVAVVNDKGEVQALSVGYVAIEAEVGSRKAMCRITVKSGSSGGSSGSSGGSSGSSGGSSGSSGGGSGSSGGSSGGSGGGSSSSKSSSKTEGVSGPSGGGALPSYVVMGIWSQVNGMWQFTDTSGLLYKNRWAAVVNPYANTAAGQEGFDWFFFDAEGNMLTGWYLDIDGNYYYLNPVSDGTRGKMVTGWAWIPDEAGVSRCYYLNPESDGTRGKMISNAVVEGYTLNSEGQWTIDGIVQSR